MSKHFATAAMIVAIAAVIANEAGALGAGWVAAAGFVAFSAIWWVSHP